MLSTFFISVYCLFMLSGIIALFIYFHWPLYKIENNTMLTVYTISLYLLFVIAVNSVLIIWQTNLKGIL